MSRNDKIIEAIKRIPPYTDWVHAERILAVVRINDPQYERYRDIKDAAIAEKDRLCDAILACEPEWKLHELAKKLRTPF